MQRVQHSYAMDLAEQYSLVSSCPYKCIKWKMGKEKQLVEKRITFLKEQQCKLYKTLINTWCTFFPKDKLAINKWVGKGLQLLKKILNRDEDTGKTEITQGAIHTLKSILREIDICEELIKQLTIQTDDINTFLSKLDNYEIINSLDSKTISEIKNFDWNNMEEVINDYRKINSKKSLLQQIYQECVMEECSDTSAILQEIPTMVRDYFYIARIIKTIDAQKLAFMDDEIGDCGGIIHKLQQWELLKQELNRQKTYVK